MDASVMPDAALRLASIGWAVFPCEPRGKVPLGRLVPHGVKDATKDPERIRAWWGDTPDANIALACGEPSGIDVLDLDVPKDGKGDDGLATMSRYESVHGQIRTLTSVTGRGGMHLFFKHQHGGKNRVKTLPGCDVRTTGGYVVLPPSVHETGTAYAWAFGIEPSTSNVQPWPAWLFEILFPPTPTAETPAPYVAPPPEVASGYGRAALVKIHAEVAGLAKGSRDDKRNAITFSAGRLVAAGLVTAQDAEEAVYGGCVVNGLVADEGEAAIRKRIKRGLDAGVKKGPRGPAPRPASDTSRKSPKADRAPAAPSVQRDDAVLLPGAHTTEHGEYIEVGTDDFTSEVLARLPPGALYRMDREVGQIVGEPGHRRFQVLDETSTRILVDTHVRLGRWVTVKAKNGEPEHQAVAFLSCHKDAAGLVLSAAASHPAVRQLQQVVSYPVYLPGFVRAKPGWNDAGGVFYDEPPDLATIVPMKPDDAKAALADLLVDFPFKDDASRDNVVAGMVTLILRPAIEGPVPFFLAMASLERTGKGKLIDTAFGVAVTGSTVPPMQVGREEAETEKRITAQILHGSSLVHLDNVPIGEALDSASLASLATAWPSWSGRTLGSSTIVVMPNRLVLAMSANNPRATGELVKRTVPIVLAPKTDHPELRDDFVHPDALAYAAAQRPKVLAALIGIVEGWKAAKRPVSPLRMGGFERWAAAVVSALKWAGFDQVMGNYREWCKAANDENADMEALVEAWARMHADSPIPPAKVLELVEATGTFQNVLAKPTRGGQMVALGRTVLTPLVDRPVGKWVVHRSRSGNASLYYLAGGLFS